MEFLSLDYIKQHSRIDFDCDDGLLELYAESAEETMAQYLNRGIDASAMVANLKEVYGRVPAPIYHAALMLVDISYEHRSTITPGNVSQVPYTFDLLIKPYIKLL